jgi:hypothetical protein
VILTSVSRIINRNKIFLKIQPNCYVIQVLEKFMRRSKKPLKGTVRSNLKVCSIEVLSFQRCLIVYSKYITVQPTRYESLPN